MKKIERMIIAGVVGYLIIEKPRLTSAIVQAVAESLGKKKQNGRKAER